MVTASVCGCVSTVSALKLRIFTVMDLKLHIGYMDAEKLSVCHHYQDNMQVFISQNVVAHYICEWDNPGKCIQYCF